MNVSISLFQKQSYEDAWTTYEDMLNHKSGVMCWDYVILTASNEEQARGYREQITLRQRMGRLPAQTRYKVLPDPEGERVGSGGATLNAMRFVKEEAGEFRGKKILVIHSGGDSKRVPQYSACGKLFSPVPRLLPDGRRSTLFDEFMIGMSGVAARVEEGMLVCSGDVLLLFNPLQIDFYGKGAAALSIKESAETGRNHGVFLRDQDGTVGAFLHKLPVEELSRRGAVNEKGNVDIDTGAVIFHAHLVEELYRLVDTPERFRRFVNSRARLSFYADFLYPLAGEATLDQYYKETPEGEFTEELRACREELWEVLHSYSMRLIRLSPASFIHFGTTAELLHLLNEEMESYRYLGWRKHVGTNRSERDFAVSNSLIHEQAQIGEGSYIEDSFVGARAVIGEGSIVSGVKLESARIPDNTVVHGLKLKNGRFVVRIYGVNDNPKENRIMGRDLAAPLWNTPLYPSADTMEEALALSLERLAGGFAVSEEGDLSLMEGFGEADYSALLAWQDNLTDSIKVESLMKVIENHGNIEEGIGVFGDGISPGAERLLEGKASGLNEDDLEEFGKKIRIYDALSRMSVGLAREKYVKLCFGTIRDALLRRAMGEEIFDQNTTIRRGEVEIQLPVRVNWGGGWSDTPPYCMENGGTVLNAAISLEGQLPVRVRLKKLEEPKVILTSLDNDSYEEFTDITRLQDSSNPFDPFALHKASLIACGLIPREGEASLESILERLGGGIYMSTDVVGVPRGSGLGTSSILAGACVKALCEFVGRDTSDHMLYNRVLCMEQLMSTGGGWQDQVGGLTRGVKMVTSYSGMSQNIYCTNLRISPATLAELNERLCLIYTGQRRLARNLLRDVIGKYVGGREDTIEVFYEIQRAAVLMRLELEKGQIERFAELLNYHWELSKRLDEGCTNTCIDQIFISIDDMISGKMICGAGGGGFLQVILKKGVTREMLRERLQEVFQDSGVDVWRCSIV